MVIIFSSMFPTGLHALVESRQTLMEGGYDTGYCNRKVIYETRYRKSVIKLSV